MIDGALYQPIYYILVTILSFFCFLHYYNNRSNIKENPIAALILAIILAFFIGFRPNHVAFVDTVGYIANYNYNLGAPFVFTYDTENIIFDNLLLWMSSQQFDYSLFFLLIALIYFVGRYIACKKMFPDNTWAAFLVFLGAFITYSSSVNGIKAGVAASIFVCAIAFKDKKWLVALLLAISWGLHHSMHVCIIAYIIAALYKNTKIYLAFWLVCFLLAVANVTYFQELFANFTDEKGASYLLTDEDSGWLTGMRYDFVIYSFMPVLVGLYSKYKLHISIKEYDFILNLYLLLNGVWMLCMYASFTNRIAALSWLLYSIVLTYPFLSKQCNIPNKNSIFAVIMLLHLSFTLFMAFIYY